MKMYQALVRLTPHGIDLFLLAFDSWLLNLIETALIPRINKKRPAPVGLLSTLSQIIGEDDDTGMLPKQIETDGRTARQTDGQILNWHTLQEINLNLLLLLLHSVFFFSSEKSTTHLRLYSMDVECRSKGSRIRGSRCSQYSDIRL